MAIQLSTKVLLVIYCLFAIGGIILLGWGVTVPHWGLVATGIGGILFGSLSALGIIQEIRLSKKMDNTNYCCSKEPEVSTSNKEETQIQPESPTND